MSELPGYDQWKLSEPDYLGVAAPCTCGHGYDEHYSDDTQDAARPNGEPPLYTCHECRCSYYTEYSYDDYMDDLAEKRAEYRASW